MPASVEARDLAGIEARIAVTMRHAAAKLVPLEEQDVSRWNAVMLAEADTLLRKAGGFDRFGPFQCRAAIQSVHAARRRSGSTNWDALVTLYEALLAMKPALGARVSYAAAIGRAAGAHAALAYLRQLSPKDVTGYQPYWAVKAHLLAETGETAAAADAYTTAIGLSKSPAVRSFLAARLEEARHLASR